ncbi:MAG TPA: DUF1275 family protein [Steroidobacteraceae bacterium]|nr:DUF1275 family protein [Steroidobacteraceae bacterium]
MKLTIPVLLSFNGGYLDTAGFLALQGLFTAHVTGNFVTLGAALVMGTTGILSKLLALPVFCGVIILTRWVSYGATAGKWPQLRSMLTLKLVLLIIGAALAIGLGPFPNGDSPAALLTGMTFVAAMAIQNAAHRLHLGTEPPTTLMTGTTTQLMIDIADSLHGLAPEQRAATRQRMGRLSRAIASFALGAALAALLFHTLHMWCFVLPPIVAVITRCIARSTPQAPGGRP